MCGAVRGLAHALHSTKICLRVDFRNSDSKRFIVRIKSRYARRRCDMFKTLSGRCENGLAP